MFFHRCIYHRKHWHPDKLDSGNSGCLPASWPVILCTSARVTKWLRLVKAILSVGHLGQVSHRRETIVPGATRAVHAGMKPAISRNGGSARVGFVSSARH